MDPNAKTSISSTKSNITLKPRSNLSQVRKDQEIFNSSMSSISPQNLQQPPIETCDIPINSEKSTSIKISDEMNPGNPRISSNLKQSKRNIIERLDDMEISIKSILEQQQYMIRRLENMEKIRDLQYENLIKNMNKNNEIIIARTSQHHSSLMVGLTAMSGIIVDKIGEIKNMKHEINEEKQKDEQKEDMNNKVTELSKILTDSLNDINKTK